ncbi:MAG: DNA primase [Chitinophagaceae bacterium]|nr:DNA primase [Chitinophagaceae bacterium]MCB9045873.1 DNA primase [Chitinophagales bacterium]
MIAPESIQEVMDRADITDVVGQFVRLKKRGANYIANCPFHNEKTPSFYVSAAKGIYKCFGCGKGGNVVTFIQEHEKLTYPEAIKWLADYYKIEIQETEKTPEQQQQQAAEESLRIINEYAAQYFTDTLLNTEEGQAIGMSYFKQRGFRKETIEKFRLGYCPEGYDTFAREAIQKGYKPDLLERSGLIKHRNDKYYDVYHGRVIFPIQAMTGRVLGFGARILKKNEKAPKYINSPENELYNKSRVLYGMHQSRQAISKLDECFLVEGYTDVISLHQGGVENVVSSSGTSLTDGQLRLIGQITKNLTILYDGDSAGVKAALRGLDLALEHSFNVQLVLLPEGNDPDSFIQEKGAEEFHQYVKDHKKDVIGFRLEVGLKEVGDDPVKKSKLVNEIAESISKINKAEDFSLQDYYIKKASDALEVDLTGMINLVNKNIREKLDNERKHRAKEEAAQEPVPQEYLPQEELVEDKGDEEQEWELVRILLEHGNKDYEQYNNVAALIHERIDPDLIESDMARMIYDSYYAYESEKGELPGANFFNQFPDVAMQNKLAGLMHTRNEISHNWKDIYGISTLNGEMNYINEIDSALSYFELKKLKQVQDEVLKRIKAEQDQVRLTALISKHLELKRAEADILKRTGTVIVKKPGK